ncbi:MAG: hypothetical protein AAGI44_09860 [Pseudomonadota bacterium]
MAQKISVTLDDDDVAADDGIAIEKARELAAGRPSAHRAKLEEWKTVPRVQMNFSQVPEPVKRKFQKEAERRGMGMKEFLYHCMRSAGVDLPDMKDIDGRRR